MRKEWRLTKSSEFATVMHYGKGWSSSLLVLKVNPNSRDSTRFGFSVGKRVGKAVVRNMVKRRLKETIRSTCVQEGWDIVIIGRKGVAAADFKRLRSTLLHLLEKAQLLSSPREKH